MTKVLYIFVLFFCFEASGQKDSIQEIEAVEVSYLPGVVLIEKSHKRVIDNSDLIELQPTDISDVLRKVSGVNIKSYGGLGGLKTVSMRSLGANHSAFVIDGIPLSNAQTGQVNLGQIHLDNIEQITSSVGHSSNLLIPVSAQISGSSFMIETMENSFGRDTLTIRANASYGSFNQLRSYVGLKYNPNKFFISAFCRFQKAEGAYQFSVPNGLSTIEGLRNNNNYNDLSYGISGGVKLKKSRIRIGINRKTIEQELPGAVIFYNSTADEQLSTDRVTAFSDVSFSKNKFYTRVFVNGILDNTNYYDPTYFNLAGEIDNQYENRKINGGISLINYWDKFQLYGGLEETLSDLHVNDSTFAEPLRSHSYVLLGGKYRLRRWFTINAQLSTQYVYELNRNGGAPENTIRVNPFVSLKSPEWRKRTQVELWYRNSFRMPTFNELYYNNIGNLGLLPEDAHQSNFGFLWTPFKRKIQVDWKSNLFFNHVLNKIVAVPTKNLFVWSMQNIGVTNTFGADVNINLTSQIKKNWKIEFDGNFTYQKTIDVTDPESPTYLHQVAYIPEITANADLSARYRKTGIRISSSYVSKRFALNENILANEIPGFVVTDLSIFHQFQFNNKQSLKVIGNVKNVFNSSYAYIRSFVMPGINYSITLSYAFN